MHWIKLLLQSAGLLLPPVPLPKSDYIQISLALAEVTSPYIKVCLILNLEEGDVLNFLFYK